MAGRQVSEGAGSLQEEITHLSAAEIVMRMIRPEKIWPKKTNKPFITHNLVAFTEGGTLMKVDDTPVKALKRLSGHFRLLCGCILILLFHLHLFMAEQIGSMGMTQRKAEMPIQGADLVSQEVRNETAAW